MYLSKCFAIFIIIHIKFANVKRVFLRIFNYNNKINFNKSKIRLQNSININTKYLPTVTRYLWLKLNNYTLPKL